MGAFNIKYETPVSKGKYTKFQKGENKIRVLSDAITGWELWANKRPVRYQEWKDVDPPEGWDNKEAKHFQAMVIWNYNLECLQVMEITQITIQKVLAGLDKSSEWGDIRGYDIKIDREGDGMETEYSTMPCPKTELGDDIKKAFDDASINLEALYTGDDPFDKDLLENEPTNKPGKDIDAPRYKHEEDGPFRLESGGEEGEDLPF